MRKSLAAAMAVITLGGALAVTAAPAEARPHNYRHYDRHHHGNNTGAAVAAGVVGLALGAALAGSSHNNGDRYYSRGYAYSDPYYGDRYYRGGDRYYRGGYARTCETSRWVWDPYIRERVLIRSHYAC